MPIKRIVKKPEVRIGLVQALILAIFGAFAILVSFVQVLMPLALRVTIIWAIITLTLLAVQFFG